MATLTFEDKTKNGLIKKFHTLLGRAGIGSEGKEAILSGFRAASTRDLSAAQLIDACNALDMELNPALLQLDRHRKLLMAAIGGWLRAMGETSNAAKIKAIACRAAERNNFNDIPLEGLRSLYGAFLKKQKDLRRVEDMTAEHIDYLSILN